MQLDGGGLGARVVKAQNFQEAAVTGVFPVSGNQAVAGLLGRAYTA
jgi:hypothetical protein